MIDTNSGEAAQPAKGFRVREIAETKNWLTAEPAVLVGRGSVAPRRQSVQDERVQARIAIRPKPKTKITQRRGGN